jgi:hypothetical protein
LGDEEGHVEMGHWMIGVFLWLGYILISNRFGMKMSKKPLSGVAAKKELQGRLEKCYICSKFLSSAS